MRAYMDDLRMKDEGIVPIYDWGNVLFVDEVGGDELPQS